MSSEFFSRKSLTFFFSSKSKTPSTSSLTFPGSGSSSDLSKNIRNSITEKNSLKKNVGSNFPTKNAKSSNLEEKGKKDKNQKNISEIEEYESDWNSEPSSDLPFKSQSQSKKVYTLYDSDESQDNNKQNPKNHKKKEKIEADIFDDENDKKMGTQSQRPDPNQLQQEEQLLGGIDELIASLEKTVIPTSRAPDLDVSAFHFPTTSEGSPKKSSSEEDSEAKKKPEKKDGKFPAGVGGSYDGSLDEMESQIVTYGTDEEECRKKLLEKIRVRHSMTQGTQDDTTKKDIERFTEIFSGNKAGTDSPKKKPTQDRHTKSKAETSLSHSSSASESAKPKKLYFMISGHKNPEVIQGMYLQKPEKIYFAFFFSEILFFYCVIFTPILSFLLKLSKALEAGISLLILRSVPT